MRKEMFENVLQNDENIIWSDGINSLSYYFNHLFSFLFYYAIIWGFFCFMMNYFYTVSQSTTYSFGLFFKVFIIVFIFGTVLYTVCSLLNSSNMFFAITDKRIILRKGFFGKKYYHYSLNNIGNCSVEGSFFDKKGKNGSATLKIMVKNFYTDTSNELLTSLLLVENLNNAYQAYNVLSEKITDNDSFRVKINSEQS